MKFTDKSVAALKMPPGKTDYTEFCEATPGYGVRLRGSGDKVSRTLFAQYRFNGATKKITLGDARQIKVETARDAAKIVFGKVAKGEDPAADREKAKAEAAQQSQTFGRTVGQYIARQERRVKDKKLRASTLVTNKRDLEVLFKPLHAMPLADIKRKDIASTVVDLDVKHGTRAAGRARGAVSAMFAWSVEMGMVEHNPVAGSIIPDKDLQPRERTLAHDEIRAVWSALTDDTYSTILKLLFYTGCRRSEIGDLQWSEIDLDTGVLTLSKERTKNSDGLELTLPPSALAILKTIPRSKYRGDYVFGKRGEKGFTGWSFYTTALNGRIAANGHKLPDWRIHDIRRTVRTGLGEIGISDETAERVIGHMPPRIQRIYDKGKHAPEIKSALLRWADHLDSIIEGRDSNVTSIKKRA